MELEKKERETGNEAAGPVAPFHAILVVFWKMGLASKGKNYTDFLRRNQGGKWNVL